MSLIEALGQVDLEAGRIYQCRVKRKLIELRVMEADRCLPCVPFDESDVMLDPWVEFPQPTALFTVQAQPGHLPLPAPPVITDDWDE